MTKTGITEKQVAAQRAEDLERDLDDALASAQDLEKQLIESPAAQKRTVALERKLAARDAEVRVLQERLDAALRDADARCVAVTTERVAALLGQNQPTVDGK